MTSGCGRLALVGAVALLFPGPGVPIGSGITYTLVDEKVSDTPIRTQVAQHLVVSGLPTKAQLEAEGLSRYRAAVARRGCRYFNPPTNIFVYVYGTKEQALAQQGLWIAMIAKGFSDKGEPRVVVNEERLAALRQAPAERFGLSEATRKHVFRDLAAAEDRATRDAMARVPDSEVLRQVTLESELETKYKAAIAAKYKLTEEQLLQILLEGVKMGWPH
jgi:hypothetical protein